jgi:uncharacterized protein YjbJ (UPF0337 family)
LGIFFGMHIARSISSEVSQLAFISQETYMNWDQVEGNWKQFKGKVKQQWGKLTDDSLDQIEGKRDQLVGQIQH